MIRLLCSAIACCVIAVTPGRAAADPKTEIQHTIDQLVDAVERFKGDDNKTERRREMRTIIEPRFDFNEMAKRSLGAEWKSRTPQEQKEFVEVFSELLASTYLGKIDMIERGMVKIGEQKVHEDKALIRTLVTYKGDTFGLDYKLIDRRGSWRVYDVIIENIGLVANYRNEFAGIIRKEEFAGLMKRLREKSIPKPEGTS